MKAGNIARVLGWTEVPDNKEEGLFLQPEEVGVLDDFITNLENSDTATELSTANQTIEQLNGRISTMKTDSDNATTLAQTQAGKITELEERVNTLEAENKELGKRSSGNGSSIATGADGQHEEANNTNANLPRYDSPEHPANLLADKFVKVKKTQ
jgi:polyhydroxyalkanoate synthesis regulator phasin